MGKLKEESFRNEYWEFAEALVKVQNLSFGLNRFHDEWLIMRDCLEEIAEGCQEPESQARNALNLCDQKLNLD